MGIQADEMDKLTRGQKKRKAHTPERRWQGDTWSGRGTGRVIGGGDRDEKGVEKSCSKCEKRLSWGSSKPQLLNLS